MAYIRLIGYDDYLKDKIQQYDTVTIDRVSLQDLTRIFLICGHVKHLQLYNYNGKSLPPLASLADLENLELFGVDSVASIPEDIGTLKHLKNLQINATHCSMPAQIGKLKSLESLSVRGIVWNEDFRRGLSGLSHLKKLRLDACLGEQLEMLTVPLEDLEELKIYNCKELNNINLIRSFPDLQKLELYNNNQLPAFPEQLTCLPNLQQLLVKATASHLSEIPALVGTLANLESLRVYSSEYQADAVLEITPAMGQLQNLKELIIEHWGAITTLPDAIGDLAQLERIHLEIRLTHLPESIGKLKNLKTLYVRGRLIELPEQIGEIKSLEVLNLGHNHLTRVPAQIGQLKNLRFLELDGNPLTHLPEEIGECVSLETLKCDNTSHSVSLLAIPENIGQLSNLTKLDINGLFDAIPASFGNLKKLEELNVYASPNLTTLPDCIGDCQSLRRIYASHTGIRTLPTSLYRLPKLWDVTVQETPAQFAPNKLERDFFDCLNYAPDGQQQPLEGLQRQAYFHIYLKNFLQEALDIPQNLFFEGMRLAYEPLRASLLAHVFVFNANRISLKDAPLKKGDVVAVVGNITYKKTEIKTRLTDAGITYRSSVTDDVTHLVVGTSPKLPENALAKNYFLFNERELTDYLNQLETPFLLSAPVADNESAENLIQLLQHPDVVNEAIALQMLEGLGVPPELWIDLLVIAKCSTNADNRNKARQLLKKNTKDAAILAALAHRGKLADPKKGYYDSTSHNIWKYSQEIKELDWVSVAYLLWVKHDNEAYRYFMEHSQPDDARRKTYLEKVWDAWVSKYNEIDIKATLTTQELSRFLNANADRLSDVRVLVVNGKHLEALPDEVYKLKSLTRLSISFSKIKSVSEEIGQLCELRDVTLISDYLSQLPEAITSLPIHSLTIKKHRVHNLEEIKSQMPNCTFTEKW